jgi:hypothetical protein
VVFAVLWLLGAAITPSVFGDGLVNPLFRRGDANLDGQINLSDASFLMDALFLGGPASDCLDAADVNDDGVLNEKDPLYLLKWLIPEGPAKLPPPPPPFKSPGIDLTADGIGCLIYLIKPPGDPVSGAKLELQGPEEMARGQKGLPLLLAATTPGPIDAFSLALLVDRKAIGVSGVDLEGTIFPEPLRAAFENSDFFRWTIIPQPASFRDVLLVGTIFIGPELERIGFPATTGPISDAPLLRLLVDVAPDAPLEKRTVLESAPLPLDFAGPITEFVGGGISILPETLPSYSAKLVEAGELILSRRADANTDGIIDITDPVITLDFLFLGGSQPSCPDGADTNDNGVLEIGDPIYTLQFLFTSGPAPPSPYPTCGVDPTPDSLPGCLQKCRN